MGQQFSMGTWCWEGLMKLGAPHPLPQAAAFSFSHLFYLKQCVIQQHSVAAVSAGLMGSNGVVCGSSTHLRVPTWGILTH